MVEEKPMKQEAAKPSRSLCDFCDQSKAVLYCRADAARLCLSCDRHVHLANSVSSKHPRFLLCNSCSSDAASIFCSSHGPAQVFCANCDFEAHNLSGPHERRPVESFSGCPSYAELVPVLGLGDGEELLKKKKYDVVFDEDDNGLIDERFWKMPQVVRLDDLIVPAAATAATAAAAAGDTTPHGFRAMGVPPPPKNRNLVCGKQKEEILQQLRELIKSEGQLNNECEEVDPTTEFQSLMPHNGDQIENLHPNSDGNTAFTVTSDFEASELQWNNDDWQEATDPTMFPYDQQIGGLSVVTSFPDGIADCHTSACPASGNDGAPGHNIVRESISPLTPKRGLEFLCPDRDTVISRYKEKRKTRRYDKLIRYESRKARADSRVRIKGRFAKTNQEPQT